MNEVDAWESARYSVNRGQKLSSNLRVGQKCSCGGLLPVRSRQNLEAKRFMRGHFASLEPEAVKRCAGSGLASGTLLLTGAVIGRLNLRPSRNVLVLVLTLLQVYLKMPVPAVCGGSGCFYWT